MKEIRSFIALMILFTSASYMFAESQGEKAFKENRPEQAITLLQEEITRDEASAAAYNYLGLAYFQLGDYDKSIEAFAKGLSTPGTNKKLLAYNQGNTYFTKKEYNEAVKSYSMALTADPKYYSALLNRANAYLMTGVYKESVNDYKKYIEAVPEDPQREEIERLINALAGELQRIEEEERFAAMEAERIAEEERLLAEEMERQRIAEEKRIEKERLAREEQERKERLEREAREAEERRIEEEKRAAEAERRRKLLEEVANSLQNTDSTNMQSGAEDLIDYEQDAELD